MLIYILTIDIDLVSDQHLRSTSPPPKHHPWGRRNLNTIQCELNIFTKGHLELKIQKVRTGVGAGWLETIAHQTGNNRKEDTMSFQITRYLGRIDLPEI